MLLSHLFITEGLYVLDLHAITREMKTQGLTQEAHLSLAPSPSGVFVYTQTNKCAKVFYKPTSLNILLLILPFSTLWLWTFKSNPNIKGGRPLITGKHYV